MKRIVKTPKVGSKVEITNGLLAGQWGVVKLVNEQDDEYHVAPWDGGECVVLSRDDISVMAGKKVGPVDRSYKVAKRPNDSRTSYTSNSDLASKLRLIRSYSSVTNVRVESDDIVFQFKGVEY